MRIRSVVVAVSGIAILVGLTGCASGVAPGDSEHIDLFAVDYTIAPSGVVHVTETLEYDFANTPNRHGIQRFLDSHFVDTATTDRVYRYTKFHATSPTGASTLLSTATQDDVLVTVGNANATVGGKQTYVLTYDVHGALNATTSTNAAGNPVKLDEFYWNVTDDEWQIPIDKTTVTVTGPTGVTDYACAYGPDGSHTDCPGFSRTRDGANFSAPRLPAGDGVTIDVGWPAGTFAQTAPLIEPSLPPDAAEVYAGSNDGPDPLYTPWNWGGGLVLLLGIPLFFFVFFRLRSRDQEFGGETPGTIPADAASAPVRQAPQHETVVPQYEPPQGFPVGAVSLLMDKQQSKIDVTVTLLDLAARGHLRIEEVAGGARHKATDYTLVATPEKATVGDTAALLPHEQLLLRDLFAGTTKSVTLSDLKYTFASEYTAVRASILGWVQTGKYFLDKLNRTHPAIPAIVVGSIVVFIVMAVLDNSIGKLWIFWPVGAFVGAVASIRFAHRAVRRSALGHAVFVELQGFKLYIATAEADQIHFEEGIDVFSKYLPWATAFGEADHWTGVFAELAKEGKFTTTPDWYVGDQHLLTAGALGGSLAAISSLGAAVSSFSSFASESMSATPHTSSSGGESGFGGGDFGGGFSGGGGGGGGGGGSW